MIMCKVPSTLHSLARFCKILPGSERAHDRPHCTRSLAENYEDLKHYMNYFNHFKDCFKLTIIISLNFGRAIFANSLEKNKEHIKGIV